jgi:hypothetical protein
VWSDRLVPDVAESQAWRFLTSGCQERTVLPVSEEPPAPDSLPDDLAAHRDRFAAHLRSVRGLSPHTVRAYCGDVRAPAAPRAPSSLTRCSSITTAHPLNTLAARARVESVPRQPRNPRGERVFTPFSCDAELLSRTLIALPARQDQGT